MTPAKAKKTKRAKPGPISSGRRLLVRTWRDFRTHWKPYLKITALVFVPVNALSVLAALANDSGFNAYATIATVVMTIALLWTIIELGRGGAVPTLQQAYYQGTAAFVRYVLVGLWLLLMLIPAGIGSFIYALGAAPPPGVLVTASDALFINTLALAFAIPSVWLLTRFGLALNATIVDHKTPWQALKYSRRLTLGRFWRVLARQLVMALVLVLMGAVTYLPVAGLGLVFHQSPVLSAFYSLLFMIMAWPFMALYSLKLYDDLNKTQVSA